MSSEVGNPRSDPQGAGKDAGAGAFRRAVRREAGKFSASRSVSAQEAGKHRAGRHHPQPLLLRHRQPDTSLAHQQRREFF